ncbi:MAG: hypothetical protein J6W30_08865 [Bacteroidales bacterium]|nr:hypothetical protein [Bacteroidales bacterium]
MKKLVLLGTALVVAAMLMFSCNKNRFDFEHFDSAQGSGQWKLPIGTMEVTLDTILNQLIANNDLLSTDDDGELQIVYGFPLNNMLIGSSLLTVGTVNATASTSFDNPFPGIPMEPIDTTIYCTQLVTMVADSATIETAVIKTGKLIRRLEHNLSGVSQILLTSPNIYMANGDTLSTTDDEIDMTGFTFSMRNPNTGEIDSTFLVRYAITYQMGGSIDPQEYEITTTIKLDNLKLKELTGYIDSYSYPYTYDSAFTLPSNISGQMSLVGAKIRVFEKNTFGNLDARLRFTRAEFYGGGATPAHVFKYYPYDMEIVESPTFINIAPDETIDVTVNSKFEAFGTELSFDINPTDKSDLVHIYDTSNLSLKFNASVPMRFSSTGVYYLDTIDMHLGSFESPEILKEVLLHLNFDSQIPFNLNAQLFTLDSITGVKTDSLMLQPLHIGGSFDGSHVQSLTQISVTKDRLAHLLASNKLAMRFAIDTEANNVDLKLNEGRTLGVTIKADVVYGTDDNGNN